MTHALRVIVCAAVLVAFAASTAGASDVQIGVNIGVPPPPVLAAPPPLVVVPSAPAVSYAPQVPYDVFYYGGQYYAWQNGWFVTAGIGQPWVYAERARIPHPVLVVPPRYYKVPPGHRGHGHGHGHGHDWDD
jgi:hypothetical protein